MDPAGPGGRSRVGFPAPDDPAQLQPDPKSDERKSFVAWTCVHTRGASSGPSLGLVPVRGVRNVRTCMFSFPVLSGLRRGTACMPLLADIHSIIPYDTGQRVDLGLAFHGLLASRLAGVSGAADAGSVC